MPLKRKYSNVNVGRSGIFLGDFQPTLRTPVRMLTDFCHILRFSAQKPLETLNLGQTSDRNGFSTLKMGGYHVASPWDQLFLTRRPPPARKDPAGPSSSFPAPFPSSPSPSWATYIHRCLHIALRYLQWPQDKLWAAPHTNLYPWVLWLYCGRLCGRRTTLRTTETPGLSQGYLPGVL